ncbi:hypothetical protein THAOC_33248 [Thalassiosira oceanica]|uniref:Uncharacterized protein n=1 Tax=Thalassiosira oceanica TaxID=159749 RepID=K0R7G5_THAOC|nr:hypothetical protein THAOC_33248 [Thalassiosira oceanica]|eukprot:EJK47994.1 hypothetical protein THAOC_33248 [Thalassiosira oceanica]
MKFSMKESPRGEAEKRSLKRTGSAFRTKFYFPPWVYCFGVKYAPQLQHPFGFGRLGQYNYDRWGESSSSMSTTPDSAVHQVSGETSAENKLAFAYRKSMAPFRPFSSYSSYLASVLYPLMASPGGLMTAPMAPLFIPNTFPPYEVLRPQGYSDGSMAGVIYQTSRCNNKFAHHWPNRQPRSWRP